MADAPKERFERVDALFGAALDLPESERDAFVDRATADDPELGRELRALLLAHRDAAAFLEAPAVDFALPLLRDDEPPPPNPAAT